jgi:putative membrane protein
MRNGLTLVAIVACLPALAACNRKDDPTNRDTGDLAYTSGHAANTALGNQAGALDMSSNINPVGGVLAPAVFASTVAGSDLFEIDSGKLAQSRAQSPALKAFAAKLIADHTRSTAMLKSAAAQASPPITLPTTLPPDLQASLGALRGAKPQDFDSGFIDTQIQAHKKAVEVLTQYANEGNSPPLKQFAVIVLPMVKSHLAHLNGMKSG